MRLRLVVACLLSLASCRLPPQPLPVPISSPPKVEPPPAPAQAFEAASVVPAFADPDRRSKLAAAFPKLDAHLARELASQRLPGLAFGVVIDGELVYAKGFGVRDLQTREPVDADTVFRIGSITKTFTSLAMLQLRDQGKLTLDDPAVRYLPELAALIYPTRDSPPLSLRHLLTHSSGLPPIGNYSHTQSDHDVTESEMLSGLAQTHLEFAPGMKYSYSNFGMGLLGLVIGRISGVRYRDYVNREIFAPLGMSSSFWDQAEVPAGRLATAYASGADGPRKVAHWRLGASESAGGIYTSLRDLGRYAAFQLAAYPPRSDDDKGPLRRSSVREAHSLQRREQLEITWKEDARPGEPLVDARAAGIGLAWWTYESCDFEQIVYHSGGTEGFRASIHLLPQRGVALIVLTNYTEASYRAISERALDILRESGGLSRRTLPISPVLAAAMQKLVGLYDDVTEQGYEELFARPMRAAVPYAAVVAITKGLRRLHGACKDPTPIEITTERSARFALLCERGRLEYDITLDPEGKMLTGSTTSRDVPASPRVAKTAGRILSLLKGWDDRVYENLLAPAFTQYRTQALFRRLRAIHQGCSLGRALKVDGELRASIAITCESGGDLKLDLGLDSKGSRVALLRITPLMSSRQETCPIR